ncbi:MAG: rod shape-determining protein MreD [Victivallales bacterium]|nr:rod shape-determining protein MreD [Victivallales bacterium]
MRTNITNREKQSLVEVEVTLHPEAIREAFLGRDGLLWRALRLAVLAVVFLLVLGTELAMPRFFPEVPVHPLLLMVAYLALHASFGVALAIACCAGFLLDVGCGMLPGAHLLPFVLVAGLLQTLREFPLWDDLGGWGRAVAAGTVANFLMAIYEALFLSIGVSWETWWQTILREGLLGTFLAAIAAAPVLFFCLDCLRTAGADEALFLPKSQETPDPCTDGTEQ